MANAISVQLYALCILGERRIPRANRFDETAIARRTRISNDDMIEGRFFAPARERRIFSDISVLLKL